MTEIPVRAFTAGAMVVLALVTGGPALATPSTTFWAPSTHAIQPFGLLHLTYDTYFQQAAAYPVDLGLEIGALPGKRLQLELGFDLLYPTFSSGEPVAFPILLNAKVGAPEGAAFEGSPGWSAGVFGVGFDRDVDDYHALHAMVGKTLPKVGTVSVGVYHGLNPDLFRSSSGEVRRSGLMAGWVSPAIAVPRMEKAMLTWDVQTGRNVFGAIGGGVALYFTPSVSLLAGPVFFLDSDLQPGGSRWMWSLQLDLDVDLSGPSER